MPGEPAFEQGVKAVEALLSIAQVDRTGVANKGRPV
jgi:hypothetical protein